MSCSFCILVRGLLESRVYLIVKDLTTTTLTRALIYYHATNEKHLITASISNCKANFKIQTIHYTVVGSDS